MTTFFGKAAFVDGQEQNWSLDDHPSNSLAYQIMVKGDEEGSWEPYESGVGTLNWPVFTTFHELYQFMHNDQVSSGDEWQQGLYYIQVVQLSEDGRWLATGEHLFDEIDTPSQG